MSEAPVLEPQARVCVVDDDPVSLAAIVKVLQPQFDVVVARNGHEALRLVRRHTPDLVLLDIEMPELDGFAVCRRLKDDALTQEVPIVFLTSSQDDHTEERGLMAGASDFIVKPARGPVVAARIWNLVRMKRLAETLRAQAQTDSLTGLFNRRHFAQELAKELRRARRTRRPMSLMMIDVDHFKAYNDFYGHLGGDGALRQVGQVLQGLVRRTGDLACRYGGEEFAILLPETDAEGAATVAAGVLADMQDLALPHAASAVVGHVSLSIGVATQSMPEPVVSMSDTGFSGLEQSLGEQLISDADTALYEAKRQGRNQAWSFAETGCRRLARGGRSGR